MVRYDSRFGIFPQPRAPMAPALTPEASEAMSLHSKSVAWRPYWAKW